jgi:hypothetical protein
MTLEVRIPISPRPAWLNRTRLIMASFRRFYPDTIFRISVGTHQEPAAGEIDRVENTLGQRVHWLAADRMNEWAGTRSEYLATMNDRFHGPFVGDHVIILDCDVLVTRAFDELFAVDAIQGVQAHVSPIGDQDWRMLFNLFGIEAPRFAHDYSGNGIMGPVGHLGPWYANSGMVFGPRALFERLCEPYQAAVAFLRGLMADTYWFDQLALALAVAKSGVPARTLPLRFNFPNQAAFDQAHPAELADVRFLHYLRTDTVHRDRDFEDLEAIGRLVGRRDLSGSNEVLRAGVASLFGSLATPLELICAEDAA